MRFTVVWRPAAEQRLAELWTESEDRSALATAADAIDRLLAHDPGSKGESRSDQARILVEPPLVIAFEVLEDDRLVMVLSVRRCPRRS